MIMEAFLKQNHVSYVFFKWKRVFLIFFWMTLQDFHVDFAFIKFKFVFIVLKSFSFLKSFYQWVKLTNGDGIEFQSLFNLLRAIIIIKYSFAMFGVQFIVFQSFEQLLTGFKFADSCNQFSTCSKLWSAMNSIPNIAKEYLIVIIPCKRLNWLWNSIPSSLVNLTHW